MRTIEHVNSELISAEKELDKWKKRVSALKSEQKDVMADLNSRFSVDVVS